MYVTIPYTDWPGIVDSPPTSGSEEALALSRPEAAPSEVDEAQKPRKGPNVWSMLLELCDYVTMCVTVRSRVVNGRWVKMSHHDRDHDHAASSSGAG